MQVRVALPPKLIHVFCGQADFRGAYGGRGSAKTRSFAKMSAVFGHRYWMAGKSGIILCGRQFQNSLEDSSFLEVKLAIQSEPWLMDFYEIGDRYIKSKDGRIEYSFSGLERNINSIKGKSHILLCWIDEAEDVLEQSWITMIPTVREDGSEIWATWNPRRKGSPVDKRFRNSSDPLVKVIELNWRDNPAFPDKLDRQRLRDKEQNPDQYGHIWEGEYQSARVGAYYATQLADAKAQGRIGRVSADPLHTIRLFADIGGTGAKADAFILWAVQIIGKEVRVLNYYESVGQPLGTHLDWMRQHGYTPGKAQIWLPHDGATQDKVFSVSYESAFSGVGYDVSVVPNQGRGAASIRVEATRRWLSSCWFNEATTQPGIDALAWYHEKIDEKRTIRLGPEHDWASHGADAFGLMCCVVGSMFEVKEDEEIYESIGGWMSR